MAYDLNKRLLPRQRRFIELYLRPELDGTQAAVLAGYTQDRNSAKVIACRLLSVYPNVMEELRRTKALYRGWRSLMKR